MKLIIFTDTYLQCDLYEKWLPYLLHNINSDNIYKILDFALERDIYRLKCWCLRFFDDNIGINKISELLKYLDYQISPEYEEQRAELRNKAIGIITDEYIKISNQTNFPRIIVFNTVQENFEKLKEIILSEGLSQSFWENLDPEIAENLSKNQIQK